MTPTSLPLFFVRKSPAVSVLSRAAWAYGKKIIQHRMGKKNGNSAGSAHARRHPSTASYTMPALRVVATAVPGVEVAAFMESVVGCDVTTIVPGFFVHRFEHRVSADAGVVVGGPIVVDLWVLEDGNCDATSAALSTADAVILAIGPDADPDLVSLEPFRRVFAAARPPLVCCVALGTAARPRLPAWLARRLWRPALPVPRSQVWSPGARVLDHMAGLFDAMAELGDGCGVGETDALRSTTALAALRGSATGVGAGRAGGASGPQEACVDCCVDCCCGDGRTGCVVQ
jgi:hypothetical protein